MFLSTEMLMKDITFEYLNLKDVVDIAKFENQVYSDHDNE